MEARILKIKNPKELFEKLDNIFLDYNEYIRTVPYAVLDRFSQEEILAYCLNKGIYGVITHELIDWFKDNVDLSNALEVGAGNGTLGRALGIRITDNCQQRDDFALQMNYKMAHQPIIDYPFDIEKIDGVQAVKKYKPSVVIGSFITRNLGMCHGNTWTMDLMELIKNCDKFYMVGNLNTHKNNVLLHSPNVEVIIHKDIPFLTRNSDHSKDVVFEFRYKKKKNKH